MPSLRETLRYDLVKRRKCLPTSPDVISRETVTESIVKDLEALKEAKAKFRQIQQELGCKFEDSDDDDDDDDDEKGAIEEEREKNADKRKAQHNKGAHIYIDKEDRSSIEGEPPLKLLKLDGKNGIEHVETKATMSSNLMPGRSLATCTEEVVNDSVSSIYKTEQPCNYFGIRRSQSSKMDPRIGSLQPFQPELKDEDLDGINANDDSINIEDDEQSRAQAIDAELKYLDVDLIKKLAFQRLQQLVQGHPEIVVQYQNRTASRKIRELQKSGAEDNDKMNLPSKILSPNDVRHLSIMFTGETSSILAQPNKVSDDNSPQLHPALATAAAIAATDEEERNYVERERSDLEKASELSARLELKLLSTQIRTRAVLTPVNDILSDNLWFSNVELHTSFFMRYRILNVGYGESIATGLDANLFLTGYCRRISSKHATIFFDEFTKTYELINYSEYGTEVNGHLYSCDFSEHKPTPPRKLRDEDVELQKNVQEIIDKRRGIKRQYYVTDPKSR